MDVHSFIKIFRRAINAVDNIYYGNEELNESAFNYHNISEDDLRRKSLEPYLAKYGERVFCYELYHQIRLLMDKEVAADSSDSSTVLPFHLQAELKKKQISEKVQDLYGVEALDKEYFPDFLLHCPDSFEQQELIIEVKTNPKLTFSDIQKDLLKIQEFITKYNYRKGIFLTVNTANKRMCETLANPTNQTWMQENLPSKSQILFMCKEKWDKELFIRNLGKVPDCSTIKE
jgi:hypothetical protein